MEERETHHNARVAEQGGEAAVNAEPKHSPSSHARSVVPYKTTALAGGDTG
jgi:hypothetical protein